MLKKCTIWLMVGMFALLTIFPFIKEAAAAPTPTSRSVTVTPTTFELPANPGDVLSEKIRVKNETPSKATYSVVIEDFKAMDEGGSVELLDKQSDSSYSLAKWVTAEPKNFSLRSGQEKEISFTINVPKNAEPGGHYASVLVTFGGGSNMNSSGAIVTSRVGSLILLRVSGNVKEDANVASFRTTANDMPKSYFQGSPVNFELRVKNNGNNHIKPKGTIVITNMFGQKITEASLEGMNVLPDAIRKMDTNWKFSALLANRYTATLVATYGQTSKPLSATTSFIIFPKYLALILIIIVLLIITMIIGRKKVRKVIHNLTK